MHDSNEPTSKCNDLSLEALSKRHQQIEKECRKLNGKWHPAVKIILGIVLFIVGWLVYLVYPFG